MIVFYKNYKRTERVILCIKSVRYLFPEMNIKCLLLYDENKEEYDSYIQVFRELNVELFFDKKTYNFGTSGVGSANNGYYFTEGINKIHNIVKDIDDKVFILDEDEFFTTGETIRFLLRTDFDLACSHWPAPYPNYYPTRPSLEVNGAFLAINPKKLNRYFPLPEMFEFIEILLGHELYDKCVTDEMKTVIIPTRNFTNYHGDGIHTNHIEEIKQHLITANIPF